MEIVCIIQGVPKSPCPLSWNYFHESQGIRQGIWVTLYAMSNNFLLRLLLLIAIFWQWTGAAAAFPDLILWLTQTLLKLSKNAQRVIFRCSATLSIIGLFSPPSSFPRLFLINGPSLWSMFAIYLQVFLSIPTLDKYVYIYICIFITIREITSLLYLHNA